MSFLHAARLPLFTGMIALALLLGGFGSWAALTRIAGAIIAPGRIEVDRNRQLLQHRDGGTVAEVLVSEGEKVAAGQLLIRLEARDLASELAVTTGQWQEVMARRARLEAERDDAETLAFDPALLAMDTPEAQQLMAGQRRLHSARRDSRARTEEQLAERIAQTGSQIAGIAAQAQATDTQLALTARQEATQADLLNRGLAQLAPVLSLQREAARLKGVRGDLDARRAEAEGRITEFRLEILRQRTTRREEAISQLRELGVQELELAERVRLLRDRIARLNITAPVAGTVYGLQVFAPGAVLRPAEPLLSLVPSDRPLIIAARVSPIHVDALHPGQQVLLRFPAFDQRQTPELDGALASLSADAFTDEVTGQGYFRVEIRLPEDQLTRLPTGTTLMPGMPVEAFMRTADHTPLAYLVKPFSDYFARAFRG